MRLLHDAVSLWLVGITDETVPQTVGHADFQLVLTFLDIRSDVEGPRRTPDGTDFLAVDENLGRTARLTDCQMIAGTLALLTKEEGIIVDCRSRIELDARVARRRSPSSHWKS